MLLFPVRNVLFLHESNFFLHLNFSQFVYTAASKHFLSGECSNETDGKFQIELNGITLNSNRRNQLFTLKSVSNTSGIGSHGDACDAIARGIDDALWERFIKKQRKNLTNVSFALTPTYVQ